MKKYTVIDIETTGLKPEEGHEITEIAGCNIIDNDIVRTFSTLCKVNTKISNFIYNLTGITQKMCNNADKFQDIFHTFMDCLDIDQDTNLIIHNAEFDYNFIMFWIEKYNIDKEYIDRFKNCNVVCSLKLARELLPNESHKLEYLKAKFSIKSKSHRALNDTMVTNKIYQELLKLKG